MSKQSAKKAIELSQTNGEPNSYDSEGALIQAATCLRGMMESIEAEGLHGDGEHASTLREAARVSQALSGVLGELRAHRKQRAAALASLRPEVVLEWARGLTDDARLHVVREIDAMNNSSGVLG